LSFPLLCTCRLPDGAGVPRSFRLRRLERAADGYGGIQFQLPQREEIDRLQLAGVGQRPMLVDAVRMSLVRPEIEPSEKVSELSCVSTAQSSAKIMGCRAPPCLASSAFVAPSAAARFLNLDFMLQSRELPIKGLRHWLPPAKAAPNGLRSFKCEIYPLTANGHFPMTPRDLIRIRRQPAHDPRYELLGEEELSYASL
jgi:hypothetical protein